MKSGEKRLAFGFSLDICQHRRDRKGTISMLIISPATETKMWRQGWVQCRRSKGIPKGISPQWMTARLLVV